MKTDNMVFCDIDSRFFQPGQFRVETDGKKIRNFVNGIQNFDFFINRQ